MVPVAPALKNILIGIVSFRRPALLRLLLQSLQVIEMPPACRVTVLVMDNDPEASSRETVEETQRHFPAHIPLHYEFCGQGHIVAGRNAILDYARAGGFDVLCFLDDDETVVPGWLASFVNMDAGKNPTYMTGPVETLFPPGTPEFWSRTGLYDRRRPEDGAVINWGITGNSWIDLGFIMKHGIRFDEFMSRTGGEDSLFFDDILRAGGKGVFVRGAVIHDHLPPERVSLHWLLQRQFRSGMVLSRMARHRRYPVAKLVVRFCKGVANIPYALVMTPIWIVQSGVRAGVIRGMARVAWGAGMLYGLFGGTYEEYKGG